MNTKPKLTWEKVFENWKRAEKVLVEQRSKDSLQRARLARMALEHFENRRRSR